MRGRCVWRPDGLDNVSKCETCDHDVAREHLPTTRRSVAKARALMSLSARREAQLRRGKRCDAS